jgi:Holliday junction DNA helicase RuvA
MITQIKGKLIKKTPTYLVVETGGVGFKVWIPLSSFKKIGESGEDVKVLTHLHVREDILQLFGFATKEERHLFQLLISVSGVGPKLAQGILSGISVEAFEQAIRNEDLLNMTKIPGVGRKTAERLVLELREKIGEVKEGKMGVPSVISSPVSEEAILALISLGYKRSRSEEAVQKVIQEDKTLSVEEVLRRVLMKF